LLFASPANNAPCPVLARLSEQGRETTIPNSPAPFRYTQPTMDPRSLTPEELEQRRAAMMGIVGLWKDRTDLPDTETYIRNLRGDDRPERFEAQWRREENSSPEVEP